MVDKIPVSVIITTLNEEKNMPRCLASLERFDEIIVVDSNSKDATADIAKSFGVSFVNFTWNEQYPKKRQWCLDHLSLKHERVFFVDADEEVTPALCNEISSLDWAAAGYFVKGAYVMNGKVLRFGLKNKKLCLFDRRKIEFPVIDDLDIEGMGEIEGHYQPVLKKNMKGTIGVLKNPVLHHALQDQKRYVEKHAGYAVWERTMRARQAYPSENVFTRRAMKTMFSKLPFKPLAAFAHSYIACMGFLMGREGFLFAKKRYDYYRLIAK